MSLHNIAQDVKSSNIISKWQQPFRVKFTIDQVPLLSSIGMCPALSHLPVHLTELGTNRSRADDSKQNFAHTPCHVNTVKLYILTVWNKFIKISWSLFQSETKYKKASKYNFKHHRKHFLLDRNTCGLWFMWLKITLPFAFSSWIWMPYWIYFGANQGYRKPIFCRSRPIFSL